LKKSSNPLIPKLKNCRQCAEYFPQSGKIEVEEKKPAKPAGFFVATKDFTPKSRHINTLSRKPADNECFQRLSHSPTPRGTGQPQEET
jgi:hypothetical protein